MRKVVTVLVALGLCSGSRAQSERAIRVAVWVLGSTPHLEAVSSACSRELAAVSRVRLVDDPTSGSDYLFFLATNESESAVAISAQVSERIEQGLRSRFYIRGNNESIPAGDIVNLMTPLGQIEVEVGPPESIPQMCRTIVHAFDVGTFTRERQNPRGGSFDDMYKSLLVRLGARRVR